MTVYFAGWGPNFLGWAGTAAPPPPAPVPVALGAGRPQRFVLPRSMAIAAQRLAGDNDALASFLALLTVGIFDDRQGEP